MLGFIIAAVAVSVVVSPFFLGQGGVLQVASVTANLQELESMKNAILKRFVEEEEAFEKKVVSSRTWRKRRDFLIYRYIDTVRQLDHLKYSKSHQK
ncbi:MAG: hypothetical protein AB7T49_06095 [Oligoflexales bacterium]